MLKKMDLDVVGDIVNKLRGRGREENIEELKLMLSILRSNVSSA